MGQITELFDDTYRDYVTAGVPASGRNEPYKSSIRTIGRQIDSTIAGLAGAFVASGATAVYPTQATLFADLTPANKTLGVVYGDTPANNGVYVKNGASGAGSWAATGLMLQGGQGDPGKSFYETALDTGYVPAGTTEAEFIDMFAQVFQAEAIRRATVSARSVLFAQGAAADLFTDESLELDFSHNFYRDGFAELPSVSSLQGWEYTGDGPYIGGPGLRIDGASAAAINRPPYGDFTALVEADMPAQDANNDYILSIVGSTLDSNIQAYRTTTGYFVLTVNDSGNLQQAVGRLDTSAQRVRVVISCTGGEVRACFNGGDILSIAMPRPANLLRFWLGRSALGVGDGLNGNIRAVMIYDRSVTRSQMQAMTSGSADAGGADAGTAQALVSHNQDPEAHGLARSRQAADFNAAALGLTLAAADTFSGTNGVITTSEVGGLTYAGLNDDNNNRAVRTNGVAGGNLKAGIVTTASADGQLYANLVPNSDQAALIFRWVDGFNFWLVGRGINGALFLNKFKAGVSTSPQPGAFVPYEAGEVIKARYLGARIWVTRIGADGVETILFDTVDADFKTSTRHGFRTLGTGTADNLRVYSREPL